MVDDGGKARREGGTDAIEIKEMARLAHPRNGKPRGDLTPLTKAALFTIMIAFCSLEELDKLTTSQRPGGRKAPKQAKDRSQRGQ